MDDCPYRCHEKMEERLRLCEDAKVRTEDNSKKVDTLFTYHDEVRDLIQETKEALIKLTESHHHWAGDITRQINGVAHDLSGQVESLSGTMTAHILEYSKFKKELSGVIEKDIKSFNWFRGPVNRVREKSPWLLALVVLIGVSLFVAGYEGTRRLAEMVKQIIGWFR